MKKLFLKAMAAGAGIILASSAGVRGANLYNDTTTLVSPQYILNFPNNALIGEQIWLGTGATPMYLTNLSFEYYDPGTSQTWPAGQQTIQADVRLYMNNGPTFNGYATPGTLFYDSGLFGVQTAYAANSTSSADLIFNLSDLQFPATGGTALYANSPLPSTFTFTVTFSGMTGADAVGLPDFEPPTFGTNYGSYWYDVSGSWQLLTNSIGPVAFGVQFNGQPTPTPEPTVLCLGALGGAMLTIMGRRRQRRG
jgi:hypothetical protein